MFLTDEHCVNDQMEVGGIVTVRSIVCGRNEMASGGESR